MQAARKIIEATAEVYEVPVEDILGRRRTKEIAEARQVAAYLLRELSHLSFPQIGSELSGRDHTTAIYAYRKIAKELTSRQLLRQRVDAVIELVSSPELIKQILKSARESGGARYPSVGRRIKEPETSDQLLDIFQDIHLTPRERDILDRYRRGLTLEEISKQFKVTRERVRQIVQKAMMKELAEKTTEGHKINIKEYIEAEKGAHAIARNKIPEDIRIQVLKRLPEIESGRTSLQELAREYQIPETKLYKMPELVTALEEKTKAKKQRWSRFYIKCRNCGTTMIPHVEKGLCENCSGKWRDNERREKLIIKLGSQCVKCEIERKEAIKEFGRDLYVSKSWNNDGSSVLLCRRCFLSFTGGKLSQSRSRRRYRG